jgi:CheY-specific phosphatase CheX
LKIEYLDPFVDAVRDTLSDTLSCATTPGPVSLLGPTFYAAAVNVSAQVKGALNGPAVYSMSSETAQELAGRLTGVKTHGFGPQLGHGLSTLANMWTDSAKRRLMEMGLACEIDGVTVFHGLNVEFSVNEPALAAAVETDAGRVNVSVAVRHVE